MGVVLPPRVDLDRFPLDRIGDASVAREVESLIAEVEALRAAFGMAQDGWRPKRLSPSQWKILRAVMAQPSISRAGLYSLLYGHDPNGGPEPKTIDTQICYLRRWLKARGFVLKGGAYGQPFGWRGDDGDRLAVHLANKKSPPVKAGTPERANPFEARQLAALRALKDCEQTIARLTDKLSCSNFQCRWAIKALEADGLVVCRHRGRAIKSGPLPRIFSITDKGRAKLASLDDGVTTPIEAAP